MKALPPVHADTPSFDALHTMLGSLEAGQVAQWGKMNAQQMLGHCHDFNRMYLGEIRPGGAMRLVIRLLGPAFLRRLVTKSPTETPRNLRTLGEIRQDEAPTHEFEESRAQLASSLQAIAALEGPCDHVLYGSMRAEDIQALVRHHTGHHFNQFGLLTANTVSG